MNKKKTNELDETIKKLYLKIDYSKIIPERLKRALEMQFKTPDRIARKARKSMIAPDILRTLSTSNKNK